LRERQTAARPAWILATVLLREIVALGYTGSHSQLRAYNAQPRMRLHHKDAFGWSQYSTVGCMTEATTILTRADLAKNAYRAFARNSPLAGDAGGVQSRQVWKSSDGTVAPDMSNRQGNPP
jgi:hypothetical protein